MTLDNTSRIMVMREEGTGARAAPLHAEAFREVSLRRRQTALRPEGWQWATEGKSDRENLPERRNRERKAQRSEDQAQGPPETCHNDSKGIQRVNPIGQRVRVFLKVGFADDIWEDEKQRQEWERSYGESEPGCLALW